MTTVSNDTDRREMTTGTADYDRVPSLVDPDIELLLRRLDAAVIGVTDDAEQWHRSVIHAKAQPGCPMCPPVLDCGWCGKAAGHCPDLAGHGQLGRGSETAWRGAA